MSNDQGYVPPTHLPRPFQQRSTPPAAHVHSGQSPVTDGKPPFSPHMLPPPNYAFPRYVSSDTQRPFTAVGGQTFYGQIPITSRQALSAEASPSGFQGFGPTYPYCPPSRIDTPVPDLTDEEVRTIRKKFDTASKITALVERAVHEIVRYGVTVHQALQQIARDSVIPSFTLC
jgi:hypothetical protein